MEKEQMFQIANLVSAYCTVPLLYMVEYYFYKNFLGFKGKAWKFILSALFITGIDFLCMRMQQEPLRILIHNLIAFLLVCILCNGNLLIKLYAVILKEAILLLISLSFLTFDFGVIPIINNLSLLFHESISFYFIKNLVMDTLHFSLLFLFLKSICKFLSLKEKSISLYESLYLLVPCVASYSIAVLFFIIQTFKIEDKEYYLAHLFPKIYYVLPFISFALLCSLVITAYTFKKMLEGAEERRLHLIMEQQFKQQLEHTKSVEGLYSGIRRVMHDMNNHLACLKILAEKNNTLEIKEYLDSMGKTISQMDFKIKTGNPISDAIINEKYHIANKEGIEFLCDFIIPKETRLDPVDLCIILSNSLDNSIEACRKVTDSNFLKSIAIKSYIRDLYLIIEISNTAAKRLQYNGSEILTTKANKHNHGIGISNIKMVIKKYNGVLDIIEEKNKVILNLMLKIK